MISCRMEQTTRITSRVLVCPKTQEEVKHASNRLGCGNDQYGNNQYMCLPNVEKTSLVEFCHDGIMGIQEEGKCLEVNASDGTITAQSCKDFLSGCPQQPFFNNDFYKYPACLDINPRDNCYTFHPSCSHEDKNWDDESDNLLTVLVPAVSVALVLVLVLGGFFFVWRKRLRKRSSYCSPEEPSHLSPENTRLLKETKTNNLRSTDPQYKNVRHVKLRRKRWTSDPQTKNLDQGISEQRRWHSDPQKVKPRTTRLYEIVFGWTK
uniref:Uncharacterized protein LOC111101829 n=1 Tax=Crassostrea virginica TaxID=6565 RepID=A0A8B8AG48_CRAVI|nr:uncharacterized protein LOC111101829 [Crassostrea virginica]